MKAVSSTIILIKKVFHRVAQWPSKMTHVIFSISVIKRGLVNERKYAVEQHRINLPKLTYQERVAADSLIECGFHVSDAKAFESYMSEEFKSACNDIYSYIDHIYYNSGRNISIIQLLKERPILRGQFETIFCAGLDIRLLKIIETYLGLPVAYGGVDVFYTIADGLERGARTWHRDSEDNPMVKVALYINDVGKDDGPLEILRLDHRSSTFDRLKGFNQSKLAQLQNQKEVSFTIESFTGQSGTVILCDTSKYYHRGRPATAKNRKALFFNYYANRPLTPYFCPNPPFPPTKMRTLLSKMSPMQQSAALWREKLSGLEKFVTKRRPYLTS